jgi:hypothetical protein
VYNLTNAKLDIITNVQGNASIACKCDTGQATISGSLLYGDLHHCCLADLETKK